MTESLTTDLSRISGAFVIGRSTAFTYKGKAVDLKQLGRELNVRYVLEGSVQRAANRMRVNVQLIDAESGKSSLGGALRQICRRPVRLAGRDRRARWPIASNATGRRRGSPRGESFRSQLDGSLFSRQALVNGVSATNMSAARDFFDRALAIDPDNVDALVGVAIVNTVGLEPAFRRRLAPRGSSRRKPPGQGAGRSRRASRWRTCAWATSTTRPTALSRRSANSSERWFDRQLGGSACA